MPSYNCFVPQATVFKPAIRLIASITNAQTPTVTTTFAHGYVDGTVVRFDIPPAVGMQQLNQQISPIIVTGPTTFTITIDTTNYQLFAIPVGTGPQVDICPLVVPIGSENNTLKPALVNQL